MGDFAQHFKDLTGAREWLQTVLCEARKSDVNSLSVSDFKLCKKEILAEMVHCAASLIFNFYERAGEKEKLSGELIGAQKSVIDLQQQLLAAKDVQLKSVTNTVENKLSEVKQEVLDFSAAVRSGASSGGDISTTMVQTAVRSALNDRADEEGRDLNVVVFGLDEEAGEKVSEKVTELLGVLDEKPKFSAQRIGELKRGCTKRPVKITFRSNAVTRQVLGKAAKLRTSEKFGKVFISPDRTPNQRARQRDLVVELKKRRAEERDKKHFIRGDNVVTIGDSNNVS